MSSAVSFGAIYVPHFILQAIGRSEPELRTQPLAIIDGPPPTFTLTAQAIGNQAKDMCPTLALDSAGNRSPTTCW